MHVLHLNYAYEPVYDGEALLVRFPTLTQLCEAQTRAGLQVTVLQRFWRDDDIQLNGVCYQLRYDGARAALAARPWTFLPHLHQIARRTQPDIVHVNGLVFPTQVLQLRHWLGKDTPIVVQHHGERPTSWKMRWLQRHCLFAADGYLFTAEAIAAEWRTQGVIRAGQSVLEVIEGSCHFAPVQKTLARRNATLPGNPAILWVGRLHERKDPLSVLAGFALAQTSLPDAHLTMIYNAAPLLPQVQAQIDQSPGLRSRVHLMGALPHHALPNWYSAADLFITGSPAEGSNYALIESMACGTFAVCSDIPANRKVIDQGRYGELYAVGDAQACAAAIIRAVSRSQSVPTSDIRTHFERNLSWSAIAQQSQQAYQKLITAKRAQHR